MSLTIPRLQEFLGLIQRCYPETEAIIAGGAVRDTLLGREVKDIDVFIKDCPQIREGQGLKLLAEALYFCPSEVEYRDFDALLEPKANGYADCDFFSVVGLPKGIGSTKAQLIFLKTSPVEKINDFDFDICQAWVTRYKVWSSPAFKRAIVSKRIEYIAKAPRLISQDHYARLKAKFPEWKFVGVPAAWGRGS